MDTTNLASTANDLASATDSLASQISTTSSLLNQITTTAPNPFLNNWATTSLPYSASMSFSQSIYPSVEIEKVIDKLPVLCKVESIKIVSKKKLQIKYEIFLPNDLTDKKFLPQTGSLYFGHGIYGVYSALENQYWNDTIFVEFDKLWKALLFIRKGTTFTSANNFDEGITNEEISLFVKKLNKYKEYAHTLLEKEIADKEIERKYKMHKNLDTFLK